MSIIQSKYKNKASNFLYSFNYNEELTFTITNLPISFDNKSFIYSLKNYALTYTYTTFTAISNISGGTFTTDISTTFTGYNTIKNGTNYIIQVICEGDIIGTYAVSAVGGVGDPGSASYVPEDLANKKTSVDAYKTSDTFYPTIKAVYDWGVGLFATAANLTSGLATKQNTLVSGTNIKTINSNTILGSGDLVIPTGTTNLSYTGSATNGTVTSDTGTDATIPATDGTNAGLFLPAEKTKLASIDLSAKENTITAGTTSQYWRGDKTFQTLDKTVVGLGNVDNTADLAKPISTATQTALNTKQASLGFTAENAANKGIANGYASLDSSGLVPSAQLPSYVDDILEFANLAAFPATGDTGKIYAALDTNKIYRWSGSAYIEISPGPGSTDSVTEGATNLYFTVPRVLASVLTGLSTVTSTAITAVDSVLVAMGKLQAQITVRLVASNNLSDLANASTARTNLGLAIGTNVQAYNAGTTTLGNATTGTGNIVLDTTPTLITPILGVSTAASINKVAITAPTTSATLTIADGATLTASGTATVSGTNTGDQTTISGNAGSATVLQTARNINGVSFNGSANITVADSTKVAKTGDTMSGKLIVQNEVEINNSTIVGAENGVIQKIDSDGTRGIFRWLFNNGSSFPTMLSAFRKVTDGTLDRIEIAGGLVSQRLSLGAGGTTPGTAPLKLTTQPNPLTVVEQGTFELVGNSLQFSQLERRRGVVMSEAVILASTTIGNATSESGSLLTAEHGSNYLEIGKHERMYLRGIFQQTATGNGICEIRVKYAGVTILTMSTAIGNIAAGTPFEIDVSTTVRSTGVSGTIQLNAVLRIDGITNVPDSRALVVVNTTTAQNTTVTAQWTVANVSNTLTIDQGYTQCIEPNR